MKPTMNTSKLVHSIIGFFVSIGSAGYAWFLAHGNSVAVAISILAGLYTIRAARSAHALHKEQMKDLNHETKIHHRPGSLRSRRQ